MMLINQPYWCPNCGKPVSGRIELRHVLHLMCSEACGREWLAKYARMVGQPEKGACA